MAVRDEEPADLLGLTQSKLEGCVRTRQASNLRRLVLLANAAFTSESAAQGTDAFAEQEAEDLDDENFRKLQEQEWFEQSVLLGVFLESDTCG